QLRKGLHISRRSALRISSFRKRLVEPSIAAAYGDLALLASGLPRETEAGCEAVQRSTILIMTLVGTHNHARRRRPEWLACIRVDSVRIVVRRHGHPGVRAGSGGNGHGLQQRRPGVAQVLGFAEKRR